MGGCVCGVRFNSRAKTNLQLNLCPHRHPADACVCVCPPACLLLAGAGPEPRSQGGAGQGAEEDWQGVSGGPAWLLLHINYNG